MTRVYVWTALLVICLSIAARRAFRGAPGGRRGVTRHHSKRINEGGPRALITRAPTIIWTRTGSGNRQGSSRRPAPQFHVDFNGESRLHDAQSPRSLLARRLACPGPALWIRRPPQPLAQVAVQAHVQVPGRVRLHRPQGPPHRRGALADFAGED